MRHLSADNTIGMKAVCCSIMLAFAVVAANASRTADALSPADFEIASLPGLESPLGFKQYSGFMPLGDAAGTELFFWFVESQNSPATDPLVLWMNGGPGASSVAYGFWTEHGPFRLVPDGKGNYKPSLYDESWNQIANVIYVEAPSGVGFSYSNDTSKYKGITDAESSFDNFLFLQAWFRVFASFKANDFYVTAESYGGHYGPTLAEQLIDNENDINMKGLLIGNPGINSDWYYNVNEYAFVTYMWSHGLIPAAAYFTAVTECGWVDFFSDCSRNFTNPSLACQAATAKAVSYVPSPIDPFNVLVPTCHKGHSRDDLKAGDARVMRQSPFLASLRERYGANSTPTYNPCLSQWTPEYMKRTDVLEAIHVDPNRAQQWSWPDDAPGWDYNRGPAGAKKDIALLFPKFFAKAPQWKIIVISGTADAAVPFLGTERWISCLGRPIKNDFRKWTIDGDVAGMIKDYDHLSFATVKGCGHMVPLYCPKAGFQFFSNWLSGEWN